MKQDKWSQPTWRHECVSNRGGHNVQVHSVCWHMTCHCHTCSCCHCCSHSAAPTAAANPPPPTVAQLPGTQALLLLCLESAPASRVTQSGWAVHGHRSVAHVGVLQCPSVQWPHYWGTGFVELQMREAHTLCGAQQGAHTIGICLVTMCLQVWQCRGSRKHTWAASICMSIVVWP